MARPTTGAASSARQRGQLEQEEHDEAEGPERPDPAIAHDA
jgi:hypothetical protein